MKLIPVNLIPSVMLLLRFAGFVPLGSGKLAFGYTFFVAVTMFFCVVPQLLFTIHSEQLDTVLKGVPITCVTVTSLIVIVVFMMKRNSICTLLDEFQVEYDKYLLKSAVAAHRLWSFHVLLLSLTASIVIVFATWVIQPLVSSMRQLVFPAWYPFEIERTEVHVLLFLQHTLVGAAAVFIASGSTSLFCELVQHCCAHLEYVSVVLGSALSGESSLEYEFVLAEECRGATDKLRQVLVWTVKRHTAILSRVKKLNDIFALLVLLDCFMALVVTAIVATEIYSETSLTQLSKNLSLFLVSLVFFFVPCLSARHLKECQLLIASVIYDHRRVSLGDEANTFLNIICMKASSPSTLTFGGIATMDLNIYTEALQMSYALFTLVYQFKSSSLN